MKKLLQEGFLIPAILFLIHQLTQKVFSFNIPFFDHYLDPFCLTAIFFPLLLIERALLFQQEKISLLESLIILVFLMLLFEGILPYFFEQFVADVLDLVAMFLGYIWFLLFYISSVTKLKTGISTN